MDAEEICELTLRKSMDRPIVGDLDGEPASDRGPLPLCPKLRIPEILGKDLLVGYELSRIHFYSSAKITRL